METTVHSNDIDESKSNVKAVFGMIHSPSITAVSDFGEQEIETKSETRVVTSPFANQGWTNLASQSEGAKILFATDEWFAAADNLLKDEPPVFDEDAYCEQGKVMDGWESRRRRETGHDFCLIKLAAQASIFALEIDTAYFTGNHVPSISLEIADLSCEQEASMAVQVPGIVQRLLHGCVQGTGASPEQVAQAEKACRSVSWKPLLPRTPLKPGYEETRYHFFQLETPVEGTHVRVNYFPDGGVARLRLWGNVTGMPKPIPGPAYSPIVTGRTCTVVSHSQYNMPSQQPYDYPDLVCQDNGGMGLACSNKHYGEPINLTQASLGRDMGDGWETARHPDRPSILIRDPRTNLVDSPLMDWCILKLGSVAATGVARVILDTKHFRGNYPESVQVEGCFVESDDALSDEPTVEWFPLVARGRMAPDSEHVYERSRGQIENGSRKVSHVKISIYPDGGLSRVRIYGQPE